MTLARFLKPYTATGLLRQFGTLSLIVIALITMALSLVISYFLRKDLLEREWRLTADYIWVEIVRQLTQTDFDAPMTRQAQEHFKKVYDVTVMMPEIVRVKIYDAAMTVAWSDEARLIGQRFPDNRELVRALNGEVAVNLKTQAKAETIYERQNSGRLVEVYVPIIFPGTTRVAGVVETYKLSEQVFANIRRAQLVVAGTALAGGIVLYLSLFSIVRLVARRLESQRALTARLQVTREEERASVAHQAREQLAQVLSALKIDLARLTARLPEQSEVLRTRTREMAALIDTAMESALQIASDSRPGILDNLGLEAALDWEARRFQGRTGIQCEVTPTFEEVDLDRERRTMMFRIFQEILANVARHAQATRVTVGLQRQGDRFLLTVKDDGRGISGREIADQKSLGLLGMRESAIVLGGDLRIASGPGRGTKVTLIVPVSRSSSLTTKAE